MYDDVDLSGGVFDFDGGGPLMAQQDSMYVDDDEIYSDDLYYDGEHGINADLLKQMQNGMTDTGATYYERISLSELLDQCVGPTLAQATYTIYPLLALCIVCRLTCLFCRHAFNVGDPSGKQLASFTCSLLGIVALHQFYQSNVIFIVMLSLLIYPLLHLTHCKCRGMSGVSVSVVTLVYLLTCELVVVKHTEWHQIRGAQMVLAMKLISLAFDLDSGSVRGVPNILEYIGYSFHVGSVIFGPWISFHDYSTALVQPEQRILDFFWVWKLVKSLCGSVFCVLMSTCIAHWVLLDTSFAWLMAFRDALSFRFSHYFICYLSEATLTLTGHGGTKVNGGDTKWDLSTTRILSIEFPRSLVDVVTNWHLPMHQWLKTYVFKTARPLGTFTAIFLTYVASSVLHGINFQLSAVLLSLGIYTYVEYSLRKRLSEAFNACIQARRCKSDCQHAAKSTNVYVILANICFSVLTMFHLAYLGLMFDSSEQQETGYSMEHTLSKWYQLGFASHWVAAGSYVFCLLI